jgi:hypothetical protein
MIRCAAALLGFRLLTGSYEPEIRFFSNVRDLSIVSQEKQNYVVVDSAVWQHARPDLADIRLYEGTTQVAYFFQEQTRRSTTTEQPARMFNLGIVGDHTEFDLEIRGIPHYDRIRLQVDAKDFVATAVLFGKSTLNDASRTQLAPSTLYDFSREKLGSNFLVPLPRSSFPYVHVQLTPGLRPEQVKGAAVLDVQDKPANWTEAGNCGEPVQERKYTFLTCHVTAGVPLERLQLMISPEQANFRRNVSVSVRENQIANGDISRVRIKRGGTQVASEQTAIDVPGLHENGEIRVTISNGDDPPLKLSGVRPEALERRIYFDPAGRSVVKMYYGDPKLEAPVFDYAKFFQEDPTAAQAQLGPDMHNAEYTGRPDERPWSERHKGLLWVAMLMAVGVLALLALHGLAPKPRSSA